MIQPSVACPGCQARLPPDFFNLKHFVSCPSCEATLRIRVFPALTRTESPAVAAPVIAEGESSCFYHPQKRAVVSCERCGRFLCALCDIEVGDKHRCPGCLSAAVSKSPELQKRRTLYDGIALALATYPLVIWPFTILTAPASLYMTVRYWRTPLSIFPRTKIRFVLAFLLAAAQVAGWSYLAYKLFHISVMARPIR
ncbi:MAG: hypothetical protein ABR611_02905 [Chthoniobacterales bacterium]